MKPIDLYYSEYKQDEFLDQEIFKKKREGIFIEVGAGDGIKFSNTYFFERKRNWSGLCIEPRLSEFKKLVQHRSCICENVCISLSGKLERFVEFTGNWLPMLSGLERNFHEEHLKIVEEGLKQTEHNHIRKTIEVPTLLLQDLLYKHQLFSIDYCSIDTEGSDLEILMSIDFNNTFVDVFSIENNYGNKEIELFMNDHHYDLINEIGVKNVALDQIYKKK